LSRTNESKGLVLTRMGGDNGRQEANRAFVRLPVRHSSGADRYLYRDAELAKFKHGQDDQGQARQVGQVDSQAE
jgi:hypothetical protein